MRKGGEIVHLLQENLRLIGFVGLFILLASFVWGKSWKYWLLGAACLVVCGATLLFAVFSAPGLEDNIDDKVAPKPTPPRGNVVSRLRDPWDSEAVADWPAAAALSLLCRIAYDPPIVAEEQYFKHGFEDVKTFVHASMIGYVVSAGDTCVLVFRGTDDNLDWFTNLNGLTAATPKGPIHRGFHGAYIPLKDQVDRLISRRQPKHLWLTGHSLGGALAVVCAFDLLETQQVTFDGIMTFGQPMVAGPQLATHLDQALMGRYVHFVNGADIVPRVPPSLRHCGSLVWFTNGGVKRSLPKRKAIFGEAPGKGVDAIDDDLPPLTEKEFERAKRQIREHSIPKKMPDGRVVMQSGWPLIEHHSMDLYLEQIHRITGIGALAPLAP
jgi:triacylglycerol lipase